MRHTLLCFVAIATMLTTGLAGVVSAGQSDPAIEPTLSEQLAIVNELARQTVVRQDATLALPIELQPLPPLNAVDANVRAKSVLADAITPLALARAIEAMDGDASETVPQVDLVALNVMAYYATVGYDVDPEFGAISRDRLQTAVELLAASGWNPEIYMPKAEPTTPPEVEDVAAFVEGIMTFDSPDVEVFAPAGQELGRDTTIVEREYLELLDSYVQEYRTSHSITEDYYQSTWQTGYSYPYGYSGYSYGYYSGDYYIYGARNEQWQVNYYEYHQEYRSLYQSTISATEFQQAVDSRSYLDLFVEVEHVTGIASIPFAATTANSQANPEAVLLGAVVIPFAFDDSWWSTVIQFDHDESVMGSAFVEDSVSGAVSYYHHYSTTYYQYVWGYEGYYYRYYYWTCDWWSCYLNWYWVWGGEWSYSYTYVYPGPSGTTSYNYPINHYYSARNSVSYSSSIHTGVSSVGDIVVPLAGVIVAEEGIITIEVPAKQYSLLARESTLRDGLSSRFDVGGGDSLVGFEGIGFLPTQLTPTRYDEQCRENFVMAPTPNDCELLVDEDAAVAGADGSDAEASANGAAEDADATAVATAENAEATLAAAAAMLEGIAANPEGFANGLVASLPSTPEPTVPAVPEPPTVPTVPEPTVPEAPEVTVPTVPEPTAPAVPTPPNPEEVASALAAAALAAAAPAQAIADDPEGFVAAREADARAASLETPSQALDTVAVANVETITVTFQVAEFTSGAAYVVSLGLVAKEGLTAIDPEDIVIKVTGAGVAGESPTIEYSQNTPCYDSPLTGQGGQYYFPGMPTTTPGECVRESDAGEGAVFRILHAIDLDGEDAITGVDSVAVNVGETADAAAASVPEAPTAPEAPEAPGVPEAPETPELPPI